MSHIFISYSHQDSDYAHKLEGELKRRGFEVWIDDRIDYGTRWPQVIQERLDACAALILIMTPRSYNSEWVQNELARARAKGKPVLPLLLEGDYWLAVQATQCVDVRDGKLPPPTFYDRLKSVLGTWGNIPQLNLTQAPPVSGVQQHSVPVPSTYTPVASVLPPMALFQAVWTEPSVVENGLVGMRIHFGLQVLNQRGVMLNALAGFWLANGVPLMDYNMLYRAMNGQVAAGIGLIPGADDNL